MTRPQAPVKVDDTPPARPIADISEFTEDAAEKLTIEFSKLSDQLKASRSTRHISQSTASHSAAHDISCMRLHTATAERPLANPTPA